MESLFPGISAIQNVHPIFVHFPIAFLSAAFLMEILALFRGEKMHTLAGWMLYLGTLCAVVTVMTGYLAMNNVAAVDPRGHSAPGHEEVHFHGNWMIAVTLFSTLVSIYFFWVDRKKKWVSQRGGLLAGLGVLVLLLSMGADRGARLVYEFGTGVNSKILKSVTEEEHHHSHD